MINSTPEQTNQLNSLLSSVKGGNPAPSGNSTIPNSVMNNTSGVRMGTPDQQAQLKDLIDSTPNIVHANTGNGNDWYSAVKNGTYRFGGNPAEKPQGQNPIVNSVEGKIPQISAPFKTTGNESTVSAVAKTVGNMPTDIVNTATGIANFLNPLGNLIKIGSSVGQTYNAIKNYSQQSGQSPLKILMDSFTSKNAPILGVNNDNPLVKTLAPQFVQQIMNQDFQGAAKSIIEHPMSEVAPLVMVGSSLAEGLGKGAAFDDAMTQASKGAKVVSDVAGKAAEGVKDVAGKGIDLANQGAEKVGLKTPPPTEQELTGKITQQTNPYKLGQAQRALSGIDYTGAKTFKDVSSKLDSAIKDNLNKVNTELDKYPETFKPSDLKKTVIGEGGSKASVNYVKEAIGDLKNIYKKSPDDLVKIKDLETKFKTDGLTSKEINDLAKQYGTEFGSKAFSRTTGEPLTSRSAQDYENIRTGIKENARGTLPDEKTKAIDKQTSDMIETKKMMDDLNKKVKVAENKLKQSNLLQKVVGGAGHLVDIVTGGGIKAFVKGVGLGIPGAKYSDILELQKQLQKNLTQLDKINSMKPEDAAKAIEKMK